MAFVRHNILPRYAKEKLRLSVNPAAEFSGGGMTNADIQYMIGGPDMQKLRQYADRVMENLRRVPGAVDVDSSLTDGKPEVGVTIDRAKAGELGVSVADAANTLRLLVAGQKVTDYNEGGEQYEVHVRALAAVRSRVEDLAMVSVPSSKYGALPLGDIVSFHRGTGPAQIDRLNRTRQVTISANLAPGTSQQAVITAIDQAVARLKLGPEYSTGLLGRSKEMAKMLRGFVIVVLMSFVFVYLVIAAQFESWLHPITILLSLPLTFPFALIALILFNQSLNLFSMLGVLVLFAVVKKNSILQIDHTNQLREAGMSRHDALIAANLDRLRPILMTTVAFVAGMFPLLISNAEGAATNKAISAVVIGGQMLSLLLTLIAVPVAYSLFDDLAHLRLLPWRRPLPAAAQPEVAGEMALAAGINESV
jgi:HAE1 family hydrophobic/amphiphilic exporter-1